MSSPVMYVEKKQKYFPVITEKASLVMSVIFIVFRRNKPVKLLEHMTAIYNVSFETSHTSDLV